MLRIRHVGLAFVLLALLPLSAASQEPKTGNSWYEDQVDLGFKVREPRDWDYVPGSPLEPNVIGKYADPGEGKYAPLGGNAEVLVEIILVKFDRRAESGKTAKRQISDKSVEIHVKGAANIDAWMKEGLDEGAGWRRVEDPTPFKAGVPDSTVSIYEGVSTRFGGGQLAEGQPIKAYVASYALSPEVDVALVGIGPGGKKWRTFESSFAGIAKTLQPLALKALDKEAAGNDARSEKRAKLQAEVARSPGWSLYETPNYFILSCYDDKAFIEEMKLRLEGIRAVYEKDYPPSLARMLEPRGTGEGKSGGEPESEVKPGDLERTVAEPAPIDPLQLGRNSVVRLCKDLDQYQQYGGPPSTSGYFSSMEEELVIYDDKANKGRNNTWGVLNHEGFHQYIHAFFGNLSPHSWYNEGTGDYYYGFEFNLKTKKFKPEKVIGRQDNLLLIRDKYVPLEDFVHWTQAQYYGSNSGNGSGGGKLEGWACYAQGWSLIYFLRTGEGKAKGWHKEWSRILPTYLDTLLETGDLEKAVDRAYEGVDWDALEACWRGHMM